MKLKLQIEFQQMTAAGCNNHNLASGHKCSSAAVVAGAEGQIALRIVRELANAGEKVVAGAQAQTSGHNKHVDALCTCVGGGGYSKSTTAAIQQGSNGCLL
jgi:hypothetical protein